MMQIFAVFHFFPVYGIEIGIGGEVMALLFKRCSCEWLEDVDPWLIIESIGSLKYIRLF